MIRLTGLAFAAWLAVLVWLPIFTLKYATRSFQGLESLTDLFVYTAVAFAAAYAVDRIAAILAAEPEVTPSSPRTPPPTPESSPRSAPVTAVPAPARRRTWA